jgi:hypothetical protein
VGKNCRKFICTGHVSDITLLSFSLQFTQLCVMIEAEEKVDDLNIKTETPFFCVSSEAKNSCRSKYISRKHSTPNPLLVS